MICDAGICEKLEKCVFVASAFHWISEKNRLSKEEYLVLLNTHSDHPALTENIRKSFSQRSEMQ